MPELDRKRDQGTGIAIRRGNTLEHFSPDNSQSVNVRNRLKQLTKGDLYPDAGRNAPINQLKLDWYCV